jgi:hypothetical protein
MVGCTKNDDCGEKAQLSPSKFESRSSQDKLLKIINTPKIENDCLELMIGFSGCDNKHEIELVCNGEIAESIPVQTSFCLIDKSSQLCEAYFEKSYTFDLSELKSHFGDEPKVMMNFVDQNKSVIWELK